MKVLVTRGSVAMGDDADAPHERVWEFPGQPGIADVLAAIKRDWYLPQIKFGRATWVVHSRGREGVALAVVAEQWKKPRLLPGGQASAAGLADSDGTVRLYFDYRAQIDPDGVYDDLCEIQRREVS
ncbi:hypothetical protein [Actinacidiphila paucisporea]|nr:hypothetical protein [Actinacidiphila paucisporea]